MSEFEDIKSRVDVEKLKGAGIDGVWVKISCERITAYIQKDIGSAVFFFRTYYGFGMGENECPCCAHIYTVKVDGEIDCDAMRAEHFRNVEDGTPSAMIFGFEVDEYFERWGVKEVSE